MKSVYLPEAEDTVVSVRYAKDKEPLQVDLLDFDEYTVRANDKAKETGQSWLHELTLIFNKKAKVDLNKSQVYFLYQAVRQSIEDIKKKLFDA